MTWLDRALLLALRPSVLGLLGLGYFAAIRFLDGRWRFVPFSLGVTLALAAVIFLMCRRPRFSLIAAGAFVLAQAMASKLKFEMKGYSLHVLDFVHEASDLSALSFVLRFYWAPVLLFVMILPLVGWVLYRLYCLEPVLPVKALGRIAPTLAFTSVAYMAHPAPRADDPPFVFGLNASSLFLSLFEVPRLIDRLPLAKRLDQTVPQQDLSGPIDCPPAGSQPDMIVVLSESQTSPAMLSGIALPDWLEASFRSGDGRERALYVETYGAGTWMTNFSVLTGLSSADLEWQGPYVNQLFENRIQDSLPKLMAACGYRTAAVIPMKGHTLNEAAFLRSLGFAEVHDAEKIGVNELGTRDDVFYRYAERLIEAHRASSDRPLFLLVQNIFAHSPYKQSLVSDQELPDRYSQDPELNEYLRRVAVARKDFLAFSGRRQKDPGANGTVLMEFGDHQSIATGSLLLPKVGPAAIGNFRSDLYRTFFAVHGYGTAIDYERLGPDGDVGFLTGRILDATDLPISPMFRDLARLNRLCQGRYHTCGDRHSVDAHLAARVRNGGFRLND